VATGPSTIAPSSYVNAVVRRAQLGELTDAEVLTSIDVDELDRALRPRLATDGLPVVARGRGVAPGVVSGIAVFTTADAVAVRATGQAPVLLRPLTRPEDLPGMLAATAIVTQYGGSTSHTAVVARGLGRVCVTALTEGTVADDRLVAVRGDPLLSHEPVTVDGDRGIVLRGNASTDVEQLDVEQVDVDESVSWLLAAAGRCARVGVRVNADTAAQARAGRHHGAQGIGLCRIEHMLLGDRQPLLARILLGAPSAATLEALDELSDLLRDDFIAVLAAMDGLPVTIRLLDPPRHEFLSESSPIADRLRETNPMLGVRGVRLAVINPLLLASQLRALVDAARCVRRDGGDPRPELLVPMVTLPAEVARVRTALVDICDELGEPATIPVGAMIETPRAALVAGDLGAACDFLSIGSNDLTALVWGLSRDDAERELIPAYRDHGLVSDSPLATWDEAGVGQLVRLAVEAARAAKPGIRIGTCGETSTDVAAVRLWHELDVDYVSCSPASLPLARFTVGRVGATTQLIGEGR